MKSTKAGGDRQNLHELRRRHSQTAAEQVKLHANPNDLTERLRQDPAFAKVRLDQVLDGARFIGRAPQQVDQFIASVVEPIRSRYRSALQQRAELKV